MTGFSKLVEHSNVNAVLQALDAVLTPDPLNQKRGVLLLAGRAKTGKDRIIDHWVQQRATFAAQQNQRELPPLLVLRELWQPERSALGRNVFVTPATCLLFTELVYGLGEHAIQVAPSHADRTWYRQPRSLYTDRQFTSPFAFVRSELNRLRIPLIVIHNAQYIDDRALKMLLLLRKGMRERLGIVLVVRLQRDAQLDEALAEELLRVPEAKEVSARMLLHQLTEHEYKNVVLEALLTDLNVDVSNDLLAHEHVLADLLWKHTGADWKRIDEQVAEPLLRELGPDRTQVRTITRAIFERILGRPLSA